MRAEGEAIQGKAVRCIDAFCFKFSSASICDLMRLIYYIFRRLMMLNNKNVVFEEAIRKSSVKDVAAKMMLAARTAPKGRGVDNVVIATVDGEAITAIAAAMREFADVNSETPMAASFLRDAKNIEAAEAIFLIGTKIKPLGITACGLCGFVSCQGKLVHPSAPCAFNTGDLGIAIGSAISVAMDHRVDNRIMFTVGKVVVKLGLLGDEVKICYGIPLSVSSKNVFFDRK